MSSPHPVSGAQTSSRLRVLFVLPTLEVGGAERVVLRTAVRLDSARFSPAVVGLARGEGTLERELAASGIPFRALTSRRGESPLIPWRFWRHLRAERPDLLMCLMFHANMLGRFAGRPAGVPIVVTSERSVGWESRARIAVNRLTVSLSDAITTNSAEGVRFWTGALGGRVPVRLLYNGVDTDSFSPAPGPPQGVVIGSLARLHRAKGQEYLVEALATLDRRAPGLAWRAVMAGSGPEEQKLRRMAAGLGLVNRLEMRPYTPDPAGFLRDLSIFVQSSVAEGLPNAVLEAMSVGLPVVATAVGGTPELVEHGTTGLLVPSRDPAALADALQTLIVRPDLRTEFGARARARVLAHFSASAAAEATEKLLDALAAEKGLAGRRSR